MKERIEVDDDFLIDGPPKRREWNFYLLCVRIRTYVGKRRGTWTTRRRFVHIIVDDTKSGAMRQLRHFMRQRHVKLAKKRASILKREGKT